MFKKVVLLVLGILVVVGVLLGLTAILGQQGLMELATAPTPTTQPTSEGGGPPVEPNVTLSEEEIQKRVEDLRRRFFEEGVTVTAKVESVYPGTGFVIADQSGTKVFIHWTADISLSPGQDVKIFGKVAEVSPEKIDSFKRERGFNSTLEDLLKGHRVYIEASEVAPS